MKLTPVVLRKRDQMQTMCDRYRKWYEYEQDCNAKSLQMITSVPEGSRLQVEFQKAVDKLAHLVAARQRWLQRLGHFPQFPSPFPKNIQWYALATLVTETVTHPHSLEEPTQSYAGTKESLLP